MKLTLLVLAAGMGSRYGGLKQLEGFGPHGETLMEYSVRDALKAGFSKVVFVIRKDFADAFKAEVLSKLPQGIEVATAFQELDELPGGFRAPEGRTKPWGTAQAVLAAKDLIDGPFVMVNADDFYGFESYQAMADFFKGPLKPRHYAMIGYRLRDTLSDHGAVTRAICERDASGGLRGLSEIKDIEIDPNGVLAGGGLRLDGDQPVSMNCFGFSPDFFELLEASFMEFLIKNGKDQKAECLLPEVVNILVKTKKAQVSVLEGSKLWFGVTYAKDKDRVRAAIAGLHRQKVYA